MRVITITAIEVIITQEEVTDVTLRVEVVVEILSQVTDPHLHTTLTNIVKSVTKPGHMPDECFVVARFQRAKPFPF